MEFKRIMKYRREKDMSKTKSIKIKRMKGVKKWKH
jgi:hypothetical protein